MSVTTTYATSLSSSSLQLNGTLDDLQGETALNVSFEWGTSIAYGNETTPVSIGSIGVVSASLNTFSLDDFHILGTIYYFRVKATNGVTTWYGNNKYFISLFVNGIDPFVIDDEMSSGTLTNVDLIDDILLLDWYHGTLDSTTFLGVEITNGTITPLKLDSTTFLGIEITGGTIT